MKPITPIQQRIYEFLVDRSKEGMTPSVREIGAAVGLRSTSSVQANLDSLEAAGYIERPPMLKRCIRIVGQADNVTHVPVLGTVTAGSPILAVQDIEGYLPFSMPGAQDKELFALKVRGESMIQAGILDGDIVTLSAPRPPSTAKWSSLLLMIPPRSRPSIKRTATSASSRRMIHTSQLSSMRSSFSARSLQATDIIDSRIIANGQREIYEKSGFGRYRPAK